MRGQITGRPLTREADTHGELEGLHETESLLDGAADGQVVHGDLTQDTLGVDNEKTTESNTLLLDQHAIAARDLLRLVSHKGQLEVRAETTLLAGLVGPGQVREVRVGRDTEHSGVDGVEAGQGIVVLDDLGRADEGEV